MTLVRALIAGANVPEYDNEDEEHNGPLTVPPNALCGSQCRVIRIKAEEQSLSEHIKGKTYEAVFVELLQKFNLLCLGLHRAIDWYEDENSVEHKRFVYINPPGGTKIVASDYLYVIVQTSKLQPPTDVMLSKIRENLLNRGGNGDADSKLERQSKVDTDSGKSAAFPAAFCASYSLVILIFSEKFYDYYYSVPRDVACITLIFCR